MSELASASADGSLAAAGAAPAATPAAPPGPAPSARSSSSSGAAAGGGEVLRPHQAPMQAPPEVPAVPAEAARGGGVAGSWQRGAGQRVGAYINVQLGDIGYLKYSIAQNSVGAHCRCDHGLCRTNRTLNSKGHSGLRGRPLGFLVAWLQAGQSRHCFDSHQALARSPGQFDDLVSLEKRQAARRWLESQVRADPNIQVLLDKERPADAIDVDGEPVSIY